MKDLDKIFTNTVTREILFEEGDWCIYRKETSTRTDVFNVIHRCDKTCMSMSRNTKLWVCGTGAREGGCGEPVPEKLKGLFMLYTWER